MPKFTINGEPTGVFARVPGLLAGAGFAGDGERDGTALINFCSDAQATVDAATSFANTVVGNQEALVINILPLQTGMDWPAERAAAVIWAFTRHAALAWAPRHIRVNALGLGVSPLLCSQPRERAGQAAGLSAAAAATAEDIAATVVAFWGFTSMTGQLIRLGASNPAVPT